MQSFFLWILTRKIRWLFRLCREATNFLYTYKELWQKQRLPFSLVQMQKCFTHFAYRSVYVDINNGSMFLWLVMLLPFFCLYLGFGFSSHLNDSFITVLVTNQNLNCIVTWLQYMKSFCNKSIEFVLMLSWIWTVYLWIISMYLNSLQQHCPNQTSTQWNIQGYRQM